jgi:SAM-dependent methyltransferase
MLDNMHRVTAVDHNPVYLERLKSRAARSNNTNLLRTLCEEVSTIESMNEYFDVALIPNNGLHCVQSRGKQLDLLKEINKVIVPDGLLLLELFNPSVRRLTPRDQSSRQPHPYLSKSHPLPELGGSFIRYITIEYDEWTQINRVVFHDTIVTDNGDSTSKVTIEHHRLIFPGELIGLIQQASFDIISLGSAWGVDSRVSGGESIRLVARKRD